jgi:hypothetical protein
VLSTSKIIIPSSRFPPSRGLGGGTEGEFLTHPPRQERTHTVSDFKEGRYNKFGQLGWSRGFMGVTDLAFLHSHWKFLYATVLKRNSCEKFEAKISEKSEKKGSEYLK